MENTTEVVVISEKQQKKLEKKYNRKQFRKVSNAAGGLLLLWTLIINAVVMIVMAIVLLLNALHAEYAGEIVNAVGTLAAYCVANTVIFAVYAKKNNISSAQLFKGGRAESGWFIVKASVAVLGLNYLWQYGYYLLSQRYPYIGMDTGTEDVGIYMLIANIIITCVIAPITEEYMFRGVLMMSLSRYGLRFAAIITAILFGLLHGNMQQTPMATMLGLVLAYVAIKTGSLKWPIFLHALNNIYATGMSMLYQSLSPEKQAIMDFGDWIFGGVLIGLTVLILVGARKKTAEIKDPAIYREKIGNRYWRFFTAPLNILFVLVYIGMIALTMTSLI